MVPESEHTYIQRGFRHILGALTHLFRRGVKVQIAVRVTVLPRLLLLRLRLRLWLARRLR